MATPPPHFVSSLRLSLRGRLALWFLAMFLVIQLTLALVYVLYERASINEEANERLLGRARAVVAAVSNRMPEVTDEMLIEHEAEASGRLPLESMLVTIYDAGGHAIASTTRPALEPAALDLAEAQRRNRVLYAPGGDAVRRGFVPRAQATRTLLLPFRGGDGEIYMLLAATRDLYAPGKLKLLERVFLIVTPIGALAAGAAGWLIAGIAVAPLRDVRRIAARLAPESIGQEMHLESRGVEVEQVERELEDARARLEQGYRTQERFMSNVSHELRTPLSVLLTQAQTLPIQDASPEVKQFVLSVEEEMRKLGQLVNSFLILTRVQVGRDTTAIRAHPVNELLMDCAEDCHVLAEQYGVSIEPHLLAGETQRDTIVNGDSFLLRTMLNNLVRNAVSFSPKGSAVGLRAVCDDGTLRITVRDQGPGIPEEMIDRIFDRFVQCDDNLARSRRSRGSGLGLEIAQGIAELHGGHIAVRNCATAGCEFTVHLQPGSCAAGPAPRRERA